MNTTRCVLVASAVVLGTPSPARTQDIGTILGKVLGAVASVDANYFIAGPVARRGVTTGVRGFGLHGLGVEALLDLTPTPHCDTLPRPERIPQAPRPEARRTRPASDTVQVDTTLTQIRVRRSGREGGDTTAIYTISKSCDKTPAIEIELGIDYSQISGFRGDSSARGAVEDKPSISLYLAPNLQRYRHCSVCQWLGPYMGVTGGLSSLKDFRMTQNGVIYNAAGTTWHVGAGAGVEVYPLPRLQRRLAVYVGWDWMYRGFREATWSLAAKDSTAAATPPAMPPDIDLSTYSWTVGIQIRFGTSKDSTSRR